MINYWAVLVAALAAMVLGFLWYGPLFGKVWMNLMNFKKEDMKKTKNMGLRYFGMVVSTLVMAYVLSHFVDYAGANSVSTGLILGFWIWLGFFATKSLGMVLWENKSFKLYVLITAYDLVSFLIMSVILAVWI